MSPPGAPPGPSPGPKPTLEQANAELQRRLGGPNRITFPVYAQRRGRQRTFDDQDVRRVLEQGAINEVQLHPKTQQWVYRVVGTDVEGDPLTVVIAMPDEGVGLIRVVTGF